MAEWVVYWLHDAYCICLQQHGYVGISGSWTTRLSQHQRNKRFPSNFEWSIIFTGTKAECLAMEHTLRPEPGIGWNQAQGGKPTVNFTLEVRARMSAAALNKPPMSEETREKRRIVMTGKTNRGRLGQKKSAEECAKISASLTGRKMSDDVKQKQSLRMKGKKYHLGFSHTEQTKERIRLKKTGVPIHTEEEKQKRRERLQGNSFTKGKPWSAARQLAWLHKEE